MNVRFCQKLPLGLLEADCPQSALIPVMAHGNSYAGFWHPLKIALWRMVGGNLTFVVVTIPRHI
jgi:hypothetical protein